MPFRWDDRQHLPLAIYVFKWLAICISLGVAVGSAVAFFLWSLDFVTEVHWQYPWLLYFLPLAGVLSGVMYHYWGQSSEAGNRLILEQIHEPSSGVPVRMAPLVLVGTLLSHLFGGSAGREGTAIQMGGSLAGALGRYLRLKPDETRILLMAGISAGFGAIFGTPIAGAVFSLEVLVLGRARYAGLIPCLIAGIIGDQVVTAWGIGHTHYPISFASTTSVSAPQGLGIDWLLMGKVAIAAMAFGLASLLFVELVRACKWLFKSFISVPWLRPAIGGCVLIALVWFLGERDYLGLGVNANPRDPTSVTIQSSFQPVGANGLSWWWKILFTAVTVSSGFKGGEVTPLFYIGATLGNTLAVLLGAPIDLMAGLGFVAVFAGATNTPIASTILAIELFAPGNTGLLSFGFIGYTAVACFVAFCFSGRTSIYQADSQFKRNRLW